MKEPLLIGCISLFFLAFLPSCGQADTQHNPKNIPIHGKIIFDSNREAPKDAIEKDGIKKGILSLYLWENGKVRKFFKGGSRPRWSSDGERIACIIREVGEEAKPLANKIGVLNKEGELVQRIESNYAVIEFEWGRDGQSLIYVGWPRDKAAEWHTYLSKIDLDTLHEEVLYETAETGLISNLNWNVSQNRLLFRLSDRLESGKVTVSRAAVFDPLSRELSTFYEKIGEPVMLPDGETLVFTTNRYPDGAKIQQTSWGVLMKYNMNSKEYEVIRPTGWVRNMRLSRDGKYLYTSEPVERDGNAIHIYSVENLKTPIYIIPSTAIYGYNDFSHDLNPDWLPE